MMLKLFESKINLTVSKKTTT